MTRRKALICDALGPASALRIAEVPAAPSKALVEVAFLALDFADMLIIQGK